MAGIALLVGIFGAVGAVLAFTGAFPTMSQLPVPSVAWPIMGVAGFVLFFITRRPAD